MDRHSRGLVRLSFKTKGEGLERWLLVKSSDYWKTNFHAQCPQSGSQPSVTPVLGDSKIIRPLWTLHVCSIQTYIQAKTQAHKIKISKNISIK